MISKGHDRLLWQVVDDFYLLYCMKKRAYLGPFSLRGKKFKQHRFILNFMLQIWSLSKHDLGEDNAQANLDIGTTR